MPTKAEQTMKLLASKLSKVKVTPKQTKKKRNRKRGGVVTTTVPAAIGKRMMTVKPKVRNSNKCTHVIHREYLQDINGSINFNNLQFPINPGLSSTFPWLSQMASLYESYIFKRLHFIYEPACPSITAGSVMLAIDFDAADQAAVSKIQFMAYHNAVRNTAWENVTYRSDLSDLIKFGIQRYVRSGPVANTDIKTYDIGNFQLATSNFVAATFVGELYVEYEVEFYTPQLSSLSPVNVSSASLFTTTLGTTNIFGDASLPGNFTTVNSGILYEFNPGSTTLDGMIRLVIPQQYLIVISAQTLPPVVTPVVFSAPVVFLGTSPINALNNVATSSAYLYLFTTTISNITFRATAVNTTVTNSFTIRIIPYPIPLQ